MPLGGVGLPMYGRERTMVPKSQSRFYVFMKQMISTESGKCVYYSSPFCASFLKARYQRLCNEAILWKQLLHPNILPFLGISMSVTPPKFCMVSKWMHHGNIAHYVKQRP